MGLPLKVSPNFVDGQLVRFPDLNSIAYNLDGMSQILLGKPLSLAPSGKPIAKVSVTANQPVASGAPGTSQILNWDSAPADGDGMFDPSNPSFLTIRTAGWYRILLRLRWASGSASERVADVLVNGTADPLNMTATCTTTMGGSGVVDQQCFAYEHLAAGAALYASVFQNSGGSLNLLPNGSYGTCMTVAYADPY